MQYHKEKVSKKKTMGEPPTIMMVLLNTMKLHIKVLQIFKQGKNSGKIIKNKLVASSVGTQYEEFDRDWAWRRIREL